MDQDPNMCIQNTDPGPVPTAKTNTEPIFLNVYEAQESIPRNEFRQPM
jgi:hypothetical protein